LILFVLFFAFFKYKLRAIERLQKKPAFWWHEATSRRWAQFWQTVPRKHFALAKLLFTKAVCEAN